MSALESVRTMDGAVWERRAETRGGLALYAVQGAPKCCPPFVMATLAELAEHGIQSAELAAAVELMGALPMPAGPGQRPLSALADHIGEANPASPKLLAALGEAVRDCREHEHPKSEDIYCGNLAGWMGERMAPVLRSLLDAEAEIERLRAERAEVGNEVARFGIYGAALPATKALVKRADELVTENAQLRAGVAELLAERHSTNESLSEAAEALRENRDRIVELERPAVERHRREVRESYRWLASHAREDGDFEGEAVVVQQLAEREQLWRQEDELAREFAAVPLAAKPWEPGPSAEASADKLTALFAPTQALREDEPEAPALMVYRASHDVIVMGLYTTAAEARKHCEMALRSEHAESTKVELWWREDEDTVDQPEDGEAELFAHVTPRAFDRGRTWNTGYVVTPIEVATAFDEEADE